MLSRFNVEKTRVSHSKTIPDEGNIFIPCPFADERHPKGRDASMGFSIFYSPGKESVFKCFGCGLAGSLKWLAGKINKKHGFVYHDVYEEVFKKETGDLDTQLARACASVDLPPPPDEESEVWEDREIAVYTGSVPKYAVERGLSIEACKAWGLGYDKREGRLVFPVRRDDGRLVGALGRAISPAIEPRWRDYWGFHKEKFLYGEDKIREADGRILLVEGAIAAVLLWTWGFRNVLATMGAHISGIQLAKLRRWGLPVAIAYDGDFAGRRGMADTARGLKGRTDVYEVLLDDGQKLDELPPEEARARVARAELLL